MNQESLMVIVAAVVNFFYRWYLVFIFQKEVDDRMGFR